MSTISRLSVATDKTVDNVAIPVNAKIYNPMPSLNRDSTPEERKAYVDFFKEYDLMLGPVQSRIIEVTRSNDGTSFDIPNAETRAFLGDINVARIINAAKKGGNIDKMAYVSVKNPNEPLKDAWAIDLKYCLAKTAHYVDMRGGGTYQVNVKDIVLKLNFEQGRISKGEDAHNALQSKIKEKERLLKLEAIDDKAVEQAGKLVESATTAEQLDAAVAALDKMAARYNARARD